MSWQVSAPSAPEALPVDDGWADDVAHWRALQASAVAGRDVVLCLGVAAVTTPFVRELRRWGARSVLIFGESEGTGTLPDPDEARWVIVGRPGATMMETIRAYNAGLESLPPPLNLVHAIVRDTSEGHAFDLDGAGDGLMAVDSTLAARGVLVKDNSRAGLLTDDTQGSVEDLVTLRNTFGWVTQGDPTPTLVDDPWREGNGGEAASGDLGVLDQAFELPDHRAMER